MRKGIRITPDAALTHTIEDLARRGKSTSRQYVYRVHQIRDRSNGERGNAPRERNEQPPRASITPWPERRYRPR